MNELEAIGKRLMEQGDADKLKALSQSKEAQKIAQMVDADAVEKAAASGDADTLKKILAQVLNSEDGRKLASKISPAMNK